MIGAEAEKTAGIDKEIFRKHRTPVGGDERYILMQIIFLQG